MTTIKQNTLRIVTHSPLPGIENMAIDEAILKAVDSGQSPPTLRLYQWSEPTISLGYFQKFQDFLDQDPIIAKMPVVRRQTGGGAILHDDELTYSLTLPLKTAKNPISIEEMYQKIHDACIDSISKLGIKAEYRRGKDRGNAQRGPFFCFARSHRLDLVIGKDKILGSAQRRIKNAALQHGSLILKNNFNQQPSAELIPNTTTAKLDYQAFLTDITEKIAIALNLKPLQKPLSNHENTLIPELKVKYACDQWTKQR